MLNNVKNILIVTPSKKDLMFCFFRKSNPGF